MLDHPAAAPRRPARHGRRAPEAARTCRAVRLVTAGGLLAASVLAAAGPASAASTVDRVQGDDRYQTAVAFSQRTFPGTADTVVVASGEGFADALAGAPAAKALGAPLLLTARGALPPAVRAEVLRLQPLDAVVLGGDAAVSGAVVTELEELGVVVEQVAGANRYDTAARVAVELVAPQPGGPPAEVLVASGEGFADGLAGGAYGAATGSPLLLTAPGALPPETVEVLAALTPGSITVLGGPSAVSAGVAEQLRRLTAGPLTRLEGDDRYATAARIAERLPAAARGQGPLLASGRAFPDALAGAALGAPLLLSEPACMPAVTASALDSLGASGLTALGGTTALSDAAASGTVCGSAPPTPVADPGSPGADLDCPDFPSKADAQATFDRLFPRYGDVHGLDADGDREACESHFG